MIKERLTTQMLLVEDNRADSDLMREVIEDTDSIRVHLAQDGEEALMFLNKQGAYSGAPDVDFILLDLNLPKMDGKFVLSGIKGDPNLRRIPAIVFTTSEADHDVLSAYDLGANCYIKKPANLDEFIRVIQTLNDFWLNIAKLPPKTKEGDV